MSYTGRPGMGKQFYKILEFKIKTYNAHMCFSTTTRFAEAKYRCNLDYKKMSLTMVESGRRMCITATLPKNARCVITAEVV